tara:strand:+ start:9166 stop:9720 length:555 start_codon:yes stop_codon:yes gene_type:complete
MDSNTINYNEEVLKGGLIIAGVSILLTMVTYIINVELMVAWWYGLLAIAISMGLVIYIGISFRNITGGYISYKDSLKFTFLVFTVSYVVGAMFNILLYNVIDPSLPEVMKELTVQNTVTMMEGFGAPQETIDASIPEIEKSIEENTSAVGIIKATPWGLLFVFVLAAISSIFVKKNEPVSDRIN